MSYYIIGAEKTEEGITEITIRKNSRASAYRAKKEWLEQTTGFAWAKVVDETEARMFCDSNEILL